MMLTEEDAFEAEPVDVLAVGDARRGYLWRDIFTRAARSVQELENPRPDQASPRGRDLARSCGYGPPRPSSLSCHAAATYCQTSAVFCGNGH